MNKTVKAGLIIGIVGIIAIVAIASIGLKKGTNSGPTDSGEILTLDLDLYSDVQPEYMIKIDGNETPIKKEDIRPTINTLQLGSKEYELTHADQNMKLVINVIDQRLIDTVDEVSVGSDFTEAYVKIAISNALDKANNDNLEYKFKMPETFDLNKKENMVKVTANYSDNKANSTEFDVKVVTIEGLVPEVVLEPEEVKPTDVVTKPEVKEPEKEVRPEPKPVIKPEPKTKPGTNPEVKPEPKPQPKPETKPQPKPETKPEPKPQPEIKPSDKKGKFPNTHPKGLPSNSKLIREEVDEETGYFFYRYEYAENLSGKGKITSYYVTNMDDTIRVYIAGKDSNGDILSYENDFSTGKISYEFHYPVLSEADDARLDEIASKLEAIFTK